MSDSKFELLTLELITKCMKEVSQELGTMAPDDTRLATALKEYSQLLQLRRAVRFATEPATAQLMDSLAREVGT